MWKRLKVKVLGSSSSRRQNLPHLSSCSDTTEERSLNDYDFFESDDPDLIRDSRKMSFPYLDKCSCGSPGLGIKESTRRTDSLRRKMSDIKRKNDSGWKDSCETVKNEYTKPESLFDDRRKATTTTPSSSSTITTTTTTVMMTTMTTSAGCTGIRNDEDRAKNAKNNNKNECRLRSQNAVQRSSTGLEDSEESEEEAEVSSESRSERGEKNSGGSSEYTSLAFDVNYVKVSPPKMTRRQKPAEMTVERKPNRGSRLSGFRASEDGTLSAKDAEVLRANLSEELSRSSDNGTDNVSSAGGVTAIKDEAKTSQIVTVVNKTDEINREECQEEVATGRERETFQTSSLTSLTSPLTSSGSVSNGGKETEYISLQDLQNQMKMPVEKTDMEVVVTPVENSTVSDSGSNRGKTASNGTRLEQVESLVDDQGGDSVTLFQDGDSSVLEFTFTVRLENDVIRRIRPEESAKPDSNSGSPIVSGSVNILKSDSTTVSVLKPVITVGLRSVSVDGTVPKSTDHDGCNGSRKKLPELESASSKHLSSATNDSVDEAPQTVDKSRSHTDDVPSGRRLDQTTRRSVDESRGPWVEGVKTVTWAFDKSGKDTTSHEFRTRERETNPKDSNDWFHTDGGRSKTLRKQQTLADLISNHQTRITTVAIVHKSADFDETTDVTTSQPVPSHPIASSTATIFSNKSTPERSRNRSSTRTEQEPELTHMSWDEVMNEAKALGIPLHRPSSASTRQQRRSSVSSGTGDQTPTISSADQKMAASWACTSCCQDTLRRAGREVEKTHTKKGSPFKEKFKLQNLFSRKQKDDDNGKTLGRSICKCQHQQQQQQQHLFQTMPSSGSGRATASVEDGACQRCVSVTKTKTSMTSGRLQSPLRMSIFSGAPNQKKSTSGTEGDGTTQRGGSHWHSPPGRSISGASNLQRDNSSANPDSSMLSPRQRTGNNNDFLKSLEQLKSCGWYWGPLGFEEAEVRLSGKPDGAFLVRDSSDDRYILSLSFRSQGTTHHTRIEHYRGMFSFYAEQNIHEAATIVEFIENAMRHSQDGKCLYYLRPRSPSAAPAPVQLLYPVSRFPGLPSLKHLAQAAVLCQIRMSDLIDRLPLSRSDKEALKRLQSFRRQRAAP